jgi:hypothetical protein
MKASTKAKSLGGSRLNPKGTRWESVGTSCSTGGDEVMSGVDCTVVSGTRVTPSKSFASVLASSIRMELACCGETALVFVSDARSMPDVSPVGAPAPSTRSTADEVSPPAWPWLPRLLLHRQGRRRDKPGCCSSPTWGRRRRFRRRRAGCRPPLSLSRCGGRSMMSQLPSRDMNSRLPKWSIVPGWKGCWRLPIWSLTGSCSSTRSRPLPGAPTVGVSNPGVPGLMSKLSPRAPAQMGRRKTEREGGKSWRETCVKGETRGLRVCPAPR